MYRIEVPTTISRIIALFYRLRLWDHNEGTFSCATVLRLFQAINFVLFVIATIISATITPKIQEAVFLTDFSILTVTHAARMVYIVWKKAKILKFVDEIGTHSIQDSGEFVQVRNKISAFLKFAEMFVLACFSNAIVAMIFPIFSQEIMVNIAFPWEKRGFAFIICHIIVSLGCVYSVIWFLLSVIIWYLMINCSVKYQLLGKQLQNLGEMSNKVDEVKACSSVQQQKIFLEDLIKAIQVHRSIHGTIDDFSSTFSIFFFIQIMTSSIVICAGVYNMAFSTHENLLEDIFNCVFSIYNFFDIFVLMYLGNEIKLSSDQLSYCLFQSNWIDQSPASKRNIIIMTEVLRRPQQMIIGKLYPLNLRTFTSIVNFAYSMFNVLRG